MPSSPLRPSRPTSLSRRSTTPTLSDKPSLSFASRRLPPPPEPHRLPSPRLCIARQGIPSPTHLAVADHHTTHASPRPHLPRQTAPRRTNPRAQPTRSPQPWPVPTMRYGSDQSVCAPILARSTPTSHSPAHLCSPPRAIPKQPDKPSRAHLPACRPKPRRIRSDSPSRFHSAQPSSELRDAPA
jgi:hypothetical protein